MEGGEATAVGQAGGVEERVEEGFESGTGRSGFAGVDMGI